MSKLFSFIFCSDGQALLQLIKDKGYEEYAEKMASEGEMAIKK